MLQWFICHDATSPGLHPEPSLRSSFPPFPASSLRDNLSPAGPSLLHAEGGDGFWMGSGALVSAEVTKRQRQRVKQERPEAILLPKARGFGGVVSPSIGSRQQGCRSRAGFCILPHGNIQKSRADNRQSGTRRTAATYSPTWWGSTIGACELNFSVRNG